MQQYLQKFIVDIVIKVFYVYKYVKYKMIAAEYNKSIDYYGRDKIINRWDNEVTKLTNIINWSLSLYSQVVKPLDYIKNKSLQTIEGLSPKLKLKINLWRQICIKYLWYRLYWNVYFKMGRMTGQVY